MAHAPRILQDGALLLALLACGCGARMEQTDSDPFHTFYTLSTSWGLPTDHVQYGPAANASPFLGDNVPAGPTTTGLLVPLRDQEIGNWCMLAAVQMVASYYGLVTEQCRLADLRDGYPEGTCCALRTDPDCDHGTDAWTTVNMLSALGLYGASSPDPLSEDELRDEIVNGRPAILVQSANASSHAIVAFGYDPASTDEPARFALNDPMAGYRQLSYEQLRTEYWGTGSVTAGAFYRLAPSPDGCNTGFDSTCGK